MAVPDPDGPAQINKLAKSGSPAANANAAQQIELTPTWAPTSLSGQPAASQQIACKLVTGASQLDKPVVARIRILK